MALMHNRDVLFQGTKAAHQKLDRLVTQRKLLSEVGGYVQFLRVMQHVGWRFAGSIQKVESAVPELRREVQLAELISEDIRDLCGAHGWELRKQDCEESQERRVVDSSWMWGEVYVMEGSALGARKILEVLKTTPGIGEATRYFKRLADDTRGRWPIFMDALNGAQIDCCQAVEAANESFEYVHGTIETALLSQPVAVQDFNNV